MNRATATLFAALFLALTPVVRAAEEADGFVPLFNGKDLSGWVPCNVAVGTEGRDTFTVKDGLIVCTGVPTGVMRTERMYENFIVELEWRHMVPKGNSGFFLWADDITSTGVPFSRGVEVQVLDGPTPADRRYTTHGDIFPIHGATATPDNPGKLATRAYPTEDRARPSPEWNHYRIEAIDGNVSLAVNGKVVTTTKNASPRKGYLCLESEGGVVHFRNIRIKELPPAKKLLDPKMVAIEDRGFKSMYNGLDLAGWAVNDAAKATWQANDWILRFEPARQAEEAVPPAHFLLRSAKSYKNYEWIVDFRQATAGPLALSIAGRPVSVTPPPMAAAPAKAAWRRLQVTVKGSEQAATIDGVAVPLAAEPNARAAAPDPKEAWPVGVNPVVATDFANFYIREVK